VNTLFFFVKYFVDPFQFNHIVHLWRLMLIQRPSVTDEVAVLKSTNIVDFWPNSDTEHRI
ncbi:MAG TPA: hypothetical protein H9825_08455, partial [Candidatus Sphingobacterium stercorigallinarum]|nr:hypothetical protein [Candidatus Sphingobacterium stercorigallinarum]